MKYWLMKSEPSTFSIDDLAQKPRKTDHWDGVRNYQARNWMRDEMKKGDLAFFYHSNCDEPGIVGIVTIVKEGYPDSSSYDPESNYYDPKSSYDNPRWFMVDVRFLKKFKNPIFLHTLKQFPELSSLQILKKGNRLSITPVLREQWNFIISLGGF